MMARFSFRNEASRRVAGAVSILLVLALQLFSSSESLHKWIHADAGSPNHQCAVTLFAHGQVSTSATALVVVAFVAAMFFLLPPFQSAVVSSLDYRFSASRAPPRV